MLYEIISKQAQVVSTTGQIGNGKTISKGNARRAEFEKRIDMLGDEKKNIYERYVLGELDADGYKMEKQKIDAELSRLEQVHSALSAELANLEQAQSEDSERKRVAGCVSAEKGLTHSLVDLLINKVLVYPNNRVTIDWKVSAFFGSAPSESRFDAAV